jgi:hypothetical protein
MLKDKILIALAIIFIVGAIFFVVRFVLGGAEDDWICSQGQWIKHGNPSSSVPTKPCN